MDRTSGEDLIDVPTLTSSQFLVRVHFDQRLSGGSERGWLCVGGAGAPPTGLFGPKNVNEGLTARVFGSDAEMAGEEVIVDDEDEEEEEEGDDDDDDDAEEEEKTVHPNGEFEEALEGEVERLFAAHPPRDGLLW